MSKLDKTVLARAARCRIARRPDMDPNRISKAWGKFWEGQSLRDWGYTVQSSRRSHHSNLPELFAVSPDGRRFRFDGCCRVWVRYV